MVKSSHPLPQRPVCMCKSFTFVYSGEECELSAKQTNSNKGSTIIFSALRSDYTILQMYIYS